MIPTLTHSFRLSESALAGIRDLLADPQVAVPFFGRVANPDMVERFLQPASATPPRAPDEFMLATAPDASVVGLASVRGETLSFLVAPAHWGLGIGRDLVSGLCALLDGREHGARLSALVYRENARSRGVLEAAGFSFAGLRESGVAAYAGRPMLRYVRRPVRSSTQP